MVIISYKEFEQSLVMERKCLRQVDPFSLFCQDSSLVSISHLHIASDSYSLYTSTV